MTAIQPTERPAEQTAAAAADVAPGPEVGGSGTVQRWLAWARPRAGQLALLGILVAVAGVHLLNLGHEFLTPWDETVHAVVARNLVDDPTTPLLYRYGALSSPDLAAWNTATVWLHIPPGGMLAAAASMKLFGVTTLALRLPGLIFLLLGVAATYWLGRRLFGTIEGLVGAFVLGFAPLGLAVVQGYAFGDMTETPVLGLTPVVVAAVVKGWLSGQRRWLVLAGVVVWALYLSKSAIGLAPIAIVVALYLADLLFPAEREWRRPGILGLATFLGTSLGLVAATFLYLRSRFPAVMDYESQNWKKAFFTNYEGWGGPVDYHLTFGLFVVYGAALSLLIVVALLTCAYFGLVRLRRADLVIVVWFIAIYLPLTIAVTKPPSLTVAAVGASALAVGRFVGLVFRATAVPVRAIGYGVVGASAVLCLLLAADIKLGLTSLGYELTPRRPMMSTLNMVFPSDRAMPYVVLAAMAAAIAGIGLVLHRLGVLRMLSRFGSRRLRRLGPLWTVLVAVTLAVPAGYLFLVDLKFVVAVPRVTVAGPPPVIGRYLEQHTPDNATVLVDKAGFGDGNGGLMVAFFAHRDTYQVAPGPTPDAVCPLVPRILAVDSTPVLATVTEYTGPATLIGRVDDWLVYQLARCD